MDEFGRGGGRKREKIFVLEIQKQPLLLFFIHMYEILITSFVLTGCVSSTERARAHTHTHPSTKKKLPNKRGGTANVKRKNFFSRKITFSFLVDVNIICEVVAECW